MRLLVAAILLAALLAAPLTSIAQEDGLPAGEPAEEMSTPAAAENGSPDAAYETRNGPRTASQLQEELAAVDYPGPWDVESMLTAYEQAGHAASVAMSEHPYDRRPDESADEYRARLLNAVERQEIAAGPSGRFVEEALGTGRYRGHEDRASPSPTALPASPEPSRRESQVDRRALCYQYDPYQPERAARNALVEAGQATYGQMGDFLVTYTWPAVYWSVATPGGMAPERIRQALLDRIQGRPAPGTDEGRREFLVAAESRARASGLQPPTTDWWTGSCVSSHFDSDQSLLLFVLDTGSSPIAVSTVMTAQFSQIHSSLRGRPGDFQCELDQARRQRRGEPVRPCGSYQR